MAKLIMLVCNDPVTAELVQNWNRFYSHNNIANPAPYHGMCVYACGTVQVGFLGKPVISSMPSATVLEPFKTTNPDNWKNWNYDWDFSGCVPFPSGMIDTLNQELRQNGFSMQGVQFYTSIDLEKYPKTLENVVRLTPPPVAPPPPPHLGVFPVGTQLSNGATVVSVAPSGNDEILTCDDGKRYSARHFYKKL